MDQKGTRGTSCDAVSLDVKGKTVFIEWPEIYDKCTSLEIDDQTLLRIAELRSNYTGNTSSDDCWA